MPTLDEIKSDDLINSFRGKAVNSETVSKSKLADDPVIKQFLRTEDKSAPSRVSKPPISGVSAAESERINAEPAKAGGVSQGRGLSDVGIDALGKGWHSFVEGAKEAGGGIGDIFANKPAQGVGKIGTGLMGLVSSPFEAVNSAGADLTGNKQITPIATVTAIPVQAAKSVVKNLPRTKALEEMVDKITSGGRDYKALAETIDAMKADSRIGPADTSPAVLSMAQKLFVTEGDKAKNYLWNTSKGRMENLTSDVDKAFDAAGGTPVHVVDKLNELSTAAKKIGTDLINPALASAKPVNITKTIENIDGVLKPGVWSKVEAESSLPLSKVKEELAGIKKYLANKTEMRTDAQDLHNFQSGLRRTAESLEKSSVGSERQLGAEIRKVRDSLVNDIEASAPGYKKGLNAYREEMHIADSFRDGYSSVFTNSKKMENRPEFTDKWFKSLTDHEKEAARQGARLAIDTEMGVARNPSLAGTNLGKSDFNQQKLEILFGKEETAKLLRDLEHTRAIKNTDQKITDGSQTAMRLAGDETIKLPVKGEGGSLLNYAVPAAAEAYGAMQGLPGVGGAIGGALVGIKTAASAAKHKWNTVLSKERNANLAELSLPVEGPQRDRLIKDLESFLPKPKQSMLSRVSNSLPIAP